MTGTYKKIEIIPSIFSDHNAGRLDLNYRRKIIKNSNIWRLNNTLLNNQHITEESKKAKSGFLSEPRAFRLQSGNDHSPSLFLTELSGIRGERAKTQPGLGSGETPKMGDSALIKTHPFLESVLALLLVEDAGEAWVWQGRNESYPGNTRGLSTFPSQQLPGLSPSLPQRGLSR